MELLSTQRASDTVPSASSVQEKESSCRNSHGEATVS